MNQVPATTGWLWVKQGFQYFKQQPTQFATLFLGYIFFALVLGFIPVIGQIIAFTLAPLFTLSFMQGCREIDQGRRVHPKLLLYGFQSPQLVRLIQLGMLYLIAALIVIAASTLIDGGVFWQVISGQVNLAAEMNAASKTVDDTNMTTAMLFSICLYMPVLLACWFAGPLIAWQQMSLVKAIFYSSVATFRSIRAFIVYGFSWLTVDALLPSLLTTFVFALTGNPNMIVLVLIPLWMILTIVLYCSFYPIYKSLFEGAPATSTIS